MTRSLIWIAGDGDGWGCSNCRWRFPVPALLSGEDGKTAYDRLAAAKFREHQCENEVQVSRTKREGILDADGLFADRARMLVKQGYRPKVAVELVLHEMEVKHGNDSTIMEKARSDAEFFLQQVRQGRI